MKKNDYRSFFANVKPFIKMSFFLRRSGITSGAFSLFMRGEEHNYCLSLDSLERLYADVTETLGNVA